MDRSPIARFYELWPVHTVQTVALFQTLKRRRSISSLCFFFPIRRHLEHTHRTKRNPETVKLKPSPHSLNHSLPLSHSHYISASLPSLLLHRILAQIARYFILFNSSFFYVNLYFLANFFSSYQATYHLLNLCFNVCLYFIIFVW